MHFFIKFHGKFDESLLRDLDELKSSLLHANKLNEPLTRPSIASCESYSAPFPKTQKDGMFCQHGMGPFGLDVSSMAFVFSDQFGG